LAYLKTGHVTSGLTCQPDIEQNVWKPDSPIQNRTVGNLTPDTDRAVRSLFAPPDLVALSTTSQKAAPLVDIRGTWQSEVPPCEATMALRIPSIH